MAGMTVSVQYLAMIVPSSIWCTLRQTYLVDGGTCECIREHVTRTCDQFREYYLFPKQGKDRIVNSSKNKGLNIGKHSTTNTNMFISYILGLSKKGV
jgi:hypothetical protein